MRHFSRKEVILKGVLSFAILFLFLDFLILAVKYSSNLHRINSYLKPDVEKKAFVPEETTRPAKDYSKYEAITSKFLKVQESFQLQAVLGGQAIILFNNNPVTVGVAGKVGTATVKKIEGTSVTLEKDDGTEITLNMFGGAAPPSPPRGVRPGPPSGPPSPGANMKMSREQMEEMLKRVPPEQRERARQEMEKRMGSQ